MQKNSNYFIANKRRVTFSAFFALFFIFTVCLAADLSEYFWVIIGLLTVTYFFITKILKNVESIEEKLSKFSLGMTVDKIFFQSDLKSFAACFIVITLFHLPAFLAYFPGIFTYDVFWQLRFFLEADYIEHHPLVHNIMVYGIYLISKYSHNPYLGVLTYTIVQTTIVNLVFSYCIHILSKYRTAQIFKIFALLFFALYPTNQVFTLVVTKDVLFSVFVLLFVLQLFDLINDFKSYENNNRKQAYLVSSIILCLLFRHNAFPAYILSLLFLIFGIKKYTSIKLKNICILMLIPVLFFIMFNAVKHFCGIMPPQIAESLSVPLQQMGRVRKLHNNELPEYDKSQFRQIVSLKNELAYTSYFADPMKFDDLFEPNHTQHCDFIENSIKENPKRFINLYLKWGREYPGEYFRAFILNTYSYWYPFSDYRKVGIQKYIRTNDFHAEDYWGTKIKSSYSFIPKLSKISDSIFMEMGFEDSLLLKIMFSLGWNFWIICTCFLLLVYEKSYKQLVPFIYITALFITVLFGPMVLLRYVYQNFLILPLLFACTFKKEEQQKTKNER